MVNLWDRCESGPGALRSQGAEISVIVIVVNAPVLVYDPFRQVFVDPNF